MSSDFLGKINAQSSTFQNQCSMAVRPSLIDSIMSQASEAERQGEKAVWLRELQDLLFKNPDVARILDLLEEVRR